MQFGSKSILEKITRPRTLIAGVCAVAVSFGMTVAACSSDTPSSSSASQSGGDLPSSTDGSGMPNAGASGLPTSRAAPSSSGTGTQGMMPASSPTASSSGTGTQATTPTNEMAGTGPDGDVVAMEDAGPDATFDAGVPTMNCTPVEWQNTHTVPNPTVEAVDPDAGKGEIFGQSEGLDAYDYTIEEFFFSGTSPAPYTTRMVVKKPKDPAKFSGTVFVEWYNVSGGLDVAVIWANSREYFMREGDVFVGVSAQQVGADTLHDIDSERYAPINHPGDTYADDIFSQAGVAIRMQSETLLGPCMPVQTVIAGGQSQSAARLSSYLDNTHPNAEVYDGYDIHSGPEPASNDPGVPTLQIFTMSEGNGALGDGANLVEWQVAGSTHNDSHIVDTAKTIAPIAGIDDATLKSLLDCANPLNEFPAYRVFNAAIDHLIRWVKTGERPPAGMPFEMAGGSLAFDEHNNVLGGIRIQDIEVPIATYGLDNAPADPTNILGGLACGLGGETIPFTPDVLMQLYPTHDDYVMKYTAAADKAVAAGFELQEDRDEAVKQAQAAAIPQ